MAARVAAISIASRGIDTMTLLVSLLVASALVRDVSYPNSSGGKTGAYLVEPSSAQKGAKKGPAVLFVHWYDSDSQDSNRTQFLREAIPLADDGVTSLLIDTMWSDTKWFLSRDSSHDVEESERQVRDLGKALDYLLANPRVDAARVAYVGHDFGAMYGMVLASREKRVKAWAFQAGTASFSDWFLYYPKREGADRQAFIDKLAPLDPVKHIGAATPLLLQFATKDPYVPEAKAKLLMEAAQEPKTVLWYESGHPLTEKAVKDRLEWLRGQLGIVRK
jgi:dienelactone hydrolase